MRTIAILLALTVIPIARADTPLCSAADTPRECLRKVVGARAVAAVQAVAAATNTGVSNAASPAHSTLQDFFTPLGALVDVSTVNNNQKSITLNYNPVPGRLHMETTFVTPQVNDVVSNLIGEIAATDLKHSLSNGDDAAVAVTATHRSRRFGTTAASHRQLVDALVMESLAADPNLDTAFEKSSGDALAFENGARAALAAALTKFETALGDRLMNQPQLYGSVSYHHRAPLVGPSVPSAKLTLEIGTQNLNDFYANEGRDCGTSCAAAFHRYEQRSPGAANAGHFVVAVEYKMRAKTAVTATNPIALHDPHRIGWSAGYGHRFAALASGKEGRIDFNIEYDGQKTKHGLTTKTSMAYAAALTDIPEIEAPRDRIRAAATFTQQLSDRVSAVGALVWTDRVETFAGRPLLSPFIPQPSGANVKRLEVHAGVQYKIPLFSPFPRPAQPPQSCCCR